ncbi:MAG: DUF421 domain-containing protein [Oscillospiraceae bacterium]|nr:DUF421 domain-containing protein [Oscillospiraceae bacterium]
MAIVICRTLIVYFALLITLRLLGKRQLGEMELSEFVLGALIADLASHPLQDMGIPMLNGLVPILTLFCCEVLIAGASMKSVRLRTAFFGEPSLLIVHGQIRQREMRKNRFTLDELMQELRSQGVSDIGKIAYAILETNGKLSVIPDPASAPVTAAQLGLPTGDSGYPTIVISDGRILEANLRHAGLDRAWLADRLREKGKARADEVFLMTVDQAGQIYFAGKENGT